MTRRSHSATSGPGRAPASDGRARHRRQRLRTGNRPVSAASAAAPAPDTAPSTALRLRAHALFPAPGAPRTGTGPPPARSEEPAAGQAPAQGRTAPGSGETAESAAPPERGRRRAGPPPGSSDRSRSGRPTGAGLSLRERTRLALGERMPSWVRLRCGLAPRTLAALAVVLALGVVLAVQHFWTGRPEPVRAPQLVGSAPPIPEATPPGPSPGPPPAQEATGRIVVDVSGKVLRPGVLRLPAGARVADALRAAGGVEAGTDLTGLNRARVLMDGEQVVVGLPQPPGGQPPGTQGPTGGGAPGGGPLSLSTATVEQLDTLPGVGPVLAQHIVDYRSEHGGFRSVDELREVKGIGDRRYEDLQPLVRP
nr:ComEA family DNA-binding protein [Streptomyces sp. ICN441]